MLKQKRTIVALILISLFLLAACQNSIPETEGASTIEVSTKPEEASTTGISTEPEEVFSTEGSTEKAPQTVLEGDGWRFTDNGTLYIDTTDGARNWSVYNGDHYYTPKWKKEWREEIVPKILKIVLGEGVTILTDHTALCCDNLKEIVLPETLETIEAEAIVLCPNLHKLDVPQSVNQITGLPILTDYSDPWEFFIAVNSRNAWFEEVGGMLIEKETARVLYAYSLEEEIIVPEYVKSLARFSFLNCQNLKTIIVAADCEIDAYALAGNVEIVRQPG